MYRVQVITSELSYIVYIHCVCTRQEVYDIMHYKPINNVYCLHCLIAVRSPYGVEVYLCRGILHH